jgi:tetratricopeptide (TPR) repeat protein
MDVERMLQAWEAELKHRRGADFRIEAAIGIASCLSQMGRHQEALAKLDEFAPRKPAPQVMATWLNCRAYLLAMLDRPQEALAHLEDAVVLVDTSTAAGRSLAGCISGTRGIALLRLGAVQEAETFLLRAFDLGKEAMAAEGAGGPVAEQERLLAAERWYWLAEIASRLGQADEARRRWLLASAAEGPFAARAVVLLRS